MQLRCVIITFTKEKKKMNFKETINKIGSYLKDRITKKEISTYAGIFLVLAGPAGWMSMEQIALVKAILTATGAIDPTIGASTLSALGAALVAYKEKK